MYKRMYKVLFGTFTAIGVALIAAGGLCYTLIGTAAGQLKDSDGFDTGLYVNVFLLLLLGGIGLVFFFIGLIGLIAAKQKEKRRKLLKETGRVIYADIIAVEQNHAVVINGRSPYLIIAQYVDELTKTIYQFKSEYIMEYPSYAKVGESVRVYADRENLRKYFMDLESLYGMTGYKLNRL